MGYYADLIKEKQNAKEEKENENFHYLGKTFSVTSGNFQQVRQQVQKAYWDKVKELEVKLRSAEGSEKQSIEKELREIREGYKETLEEFDRFNNEKEEGYYAKLAEEKKAKRNALEPVQRAEQLAREGKQYKDIIETIKKEYNLPTDKATRAADQGKRNYELNPINGEHKKPAKF